MALLVDHQPVLRAFVISLLPGAPGTDDVIQEINAVLWRKRSEFRLGTNFRAWMFQVARYKVLGHRRMMRRQRREVLDDDLLEKLADDAGDRFDRETEQRRMSALRRCISKLREKDRDLLLRRYWKRQSLQDFAVMSGLSVSNVKVRLFRLRAVLKRCIEGEEGAAG